MLQLITSLLSALAEWFGFRKSMANARAAHGRVGASAAAPFTSLVYRWSGPLGKPRSQELILRVGNQESRTIVIDELFWSTPRTRAKWAAAYVSNPEGMTLRQGDGTDFALDPNDTLSAVVGSRYCDGFAQKLSLVCGLRLVVKLRSGESIQLRAPRAYRSFLAGALGFGRFGCSVVRLQSYAWP